MTKPKPLSAAGLFHFLQDSAHKILLRKYGFRFKEFKLGGGETQCWYFSDDETIMISYRDSRKK